MPPARVLPNQRVSPQFHALEAQRVRRGEMVHRRRIQRARGIVPQRLHFRRQAHGRHVLHAAVGVDFVEEGVVDGIQNTARRQLYDSVSTVLNDQFNRLSTRNMMTKIGEAIVNNNEIITNTLANMIIHKDYVENSNLIVYNTSYRYCRDITSLLIKLANSFKNVKKLIYFEDQKTMLIEHQYDDDHLAEYILKYKPRSKTFVFYVKL